VAGAERSSAAVFEPSDTLTVTLTRYLAYQSVLPGTTRSELYELPVAYHSVLPETTRSELYELSVAYQNVLPGTTRSGLEELPVQTANSGRHCPFAISLSSVHVYSGVALAPFDVHYDNHITALYTPPRKPSYIDGGRKLCKWSQSVKVLWLSFRRKARLTR